MSADVGEHRPRPTWLPPRRLWAAPMLVVVWVLIVGGLWQVRLDTRIDSFVQRDGAAYRALQSHQERFGSDPVVVSLVAKHSTGFLLDQAQLPLLLALEGKLAALPHVATVYGPATVLNQTAKGLQDMIATISGERDGIKEAVRQLALNRGVSSAAADRAARLSLVRFDRRYGRLIARALPVGLPTLRNQVFVGDVIFGADGSPRPQWKLMVPDTRAVTILIRPQGGLSQTELSDVVDRIRRTVDRSQLAASTTQITGVPVVMVALADEARSEVPMLGIVAVGAVGAILMFVPWTRNRRRRFRPLFCALTGSGATLAIFGWTGHALSLGAIAFLPILLGVGSDFPLYLARGVPRRIVLATAAAAALAFVSLGLSALPFVRELGIALAIGVVLTAAVSMMLGTTVDTSNVEANTTREASRSGSTTRRIPRPVLGVIASVLAVAVSGVGWIGLFHLPVEASPDQLARGASAVADAQAVGARLGVAGEVDVVIHGSDVINPAVIAWARKAEADVVRGHGDQLVPIVSMGRLLNFLGGDPTVGQAAAALKVVPPYLVSSVISRDRQWGTIALGTDSLDLQKQDLLLRRLRTDLPRPPAGYAVELVGLPVVAARSLDLVTTDGVRLNGAGVVAALLALFLLLPKRSDAMRAAIVVALAGGWLFALVWLLFGSLTPLTIAVGALVTVTSCEFAVMLSYSARHRAAWTRVCSGTAAAAGAVGYLVLVGSHLSFLREFGALLAAGVLLSLVAARLVVWLWPPQVDTWPHSEGIPG